MLGHHGPRWLAWVPRKYEAYTVFPAAAKSPSCSHVGDVRCFVDGIRYSVASSGSPGPTSIGSSADAYRCCTAASRSLGVPGFHDVASASRMNPTGRLAYRAE